MAPMLLIDENAFLEHGRILMDVLEQSEGLISQTEAARIIGCSRQAITGFIRRGTLSSLRVGGRPLLRKSEVWEYAQRTAMKGTARRREKRVRAISAPLQQPVSRSSERGLPPYPGDSE
jgi:excisionase family DNA binding protein